MRKRRKKMIRGYEELERKQLGRISKRASFFSVSLMQCKPSAETYQKI